MEGHESGMNDGSRNESKLEVVGAEMLLFSNQKGGKKRGRPRLEENQNKPLSAYMRKKYQIDDQKLIQHQQQQQQPCVAPVPPPAKAIVPKEHEKMQEQQQHPIKIAPQPTILPTIQPQKPPKPQKPSPPPVQQQPPPPAAPHNINLTNARHMRTHLSTHSQTYAHLLSLEHTLDKLLHAKHRLVKDSLSSHYSASASHSISTSKTFRLYITHSFAHQSPHSRESHLLPHSTTPTPMWKLKIFGKTLAQHSAIDHQPNDSPSDNNNSNTTSNLNTTTQRNNEYRFGHVIRKVFIELHPCGEVSGSVVNKGDDVVLSHEKVSENEEHGVEWIEWERGSTSDERSIDGVEVCRKGSRNVRANIVIWPDYNGSNRYRVTKCLAVVCGGDGRARGGRTKHEIMRSVLEYIEKNGLVVRQAKREEQDKELSGVDVRLNENLMDLIESTPKEWRNAWNSGGIQDGNQVQLDVLPVERVIQAVRYHIMPLDPLMIRYDVVIDGGMAKDDACIRCFDIQMEVGSDRGDCAMEVHHNYGSAVPHHSEYQAVTAKHLDALEQLGKHHQQYNLLSEFGNNPAVAMKKLVLNSGAKRDEWVNEKENLKLAELIVNGEVVRDRNSAVFDGMWVSEAGARYLLKKCIADLNRKELEEKKRAESNQAIPNP
uniref:Uncharacterized protein n=1 Tax=Timspurckia oligopyrenoides TaxID=708627 RepID=A0A7S0ZAY6_9RHOD|mmetsp:Transcript_10743/g.19411  ORF Transcript_10743/g.19411 Transcript_10743/m.19411 type:complete len:656 (+) Transcript_10743:2441-4408(+)